LQEPNFGCVTLSGGFWGERLKTHREVTIHHALDMLEQDFHLRNFDAAAGVVDAPCAGHAAFDSDLYKVLEGALLTLSLHPDESLMRRVEDAVNRILAAQQPDGFLIAYFILQDQANRWENLRQMHQMYCAGHFFELAVAHHQLTRDTKALEAAQRFVDHMDSIFGPGKRYDVDGHQEVELALVKLYRETGERQHIELARFFLDERGHAHGTERRPFDASAQAEPVMPEGELEGDARREFWHAQLRFRNGRMQDHKPVVDQHEATGHAVRAAYMYAGMTDIVRFTDDAPDYMQALDHIWDDIISSKLYITGGLGSGQHDDEGFGDPYLLPNGTAYCESCAAIANVLWQHRMALLKGQAQYADVMELSLYNGVLSGISISGDKFFYENHLSSEAGEERRSWIGISCCPTNLARIIPQVGQLAYASGKRQLTVNLYVSGEASLVMEGEHTVTLTQQTDFPRDGKISLTVAPTHASTFTLCLRVPGWATGRPVPGDLYRFTDSDALPIALQINSEPLEYVIQDDGYIHLEREWQPGDAVNLDIPMPVRRVHAHAKVDANKGKVALMRGPLTYCIEAADHPGIDLFNVAIPQAATIRAEYRPELLGGVVVLLADAMDDNDQPVTLSAIPSYAWANRKIGAMTVWINEN
jgi:DUF1680 family protein